MAGTILVPIRRSDRIEEIIPYIEAIAPPMARVVFLIPYPVELWLWLSDHWITTESPREAMLAGRRLQEKYSWEMQRALAEQKIAAARQALQKKGVEVAVDVYTGSLGNLLAEYRASGDVRLIIMRARNGLRIIRYLQEKLSFLGLVKRPSFRPVLLLQLEHPAANHA